MLDHTITVEPSILGPHFKTSYLTSNSNNYLVMYKMSLFSLSHASRAAGAKARGVKLPDDEEEHHHS